jgi:pimeloyl-ACP methyl ester carboxylesterase
MANFVLVHGAWHGGWCWKHVAPLLRAAGHNVFTPSLTGLGSRLHLAHAGISLDTHISDIIGVINSEELENVILCGHSYGGMVVTGVGECVPEKINTIIYLDAFMPEDGDSMISFALPDVVGNQLKQAGHTGDGWQMDPLSPEYFGVLRKEDAEWIRECCTPQPVLTWLQAVSRSDLWESIKNKVYIHAEKHPYETFRGFAERFKADPDWAFYGLPCGHEIMIDLPKELAEIYLEIAAKNAA